MKITQISIHQPVLAIMVILAFVTFGLVAFLGLPIDLMPNIELPFVSVQAIYPGAGPEEIETAVVKPIEEQLTTVSGIKNITAFCAEGLGFLFVEFNLGVNPDIASIDVKDKIDAILFKLPRDLQKPVVSKFDMNSQPILDVAMTASMPPLELRHIADKQIKEDLVRIPGVAAVAITGGREREIRINLRKEKLDALGLSVTAVASMIGAQTVDIPGGQVTGDRKEYTVRIKGQFESLHQISDLRIPVSRPGGPSMSVPLSALGAVEDAYKEVRQGARFNGRNSVGISIQKRPDANTVEVADRCAKALREIEAKLPVGSKLSIVRDRSDFIRTSVNDMYSNVAIGILLTSILLLLFLHDVRLTLIAAITIPASLIVTFMFMQMLGFTINVITLMSLAISVGTLVTNAILVLENIVRHRRMGNAINEASLKGTTEIAVAVIASALTNVAVFVPIATMQGITGQIFKALGLTITAATIISLALSFTLAPLMASKLLGRTGLQFKFAWFEVFLSWLERRYVYLLQTALAHKVRVIVSTVLLLFTSFFAARFVGSEFFPSTDAGLVDISVEMPSGTSLSATDRVLQTVETRVSKIPELVDVYSSLGGSGTSSGVNFGAVTLRLKDAKQRKRSTKEVIGDIRPMLADIPDARFTAKEMSTMGGGGNQADIQVEVTGDDMDKILRLTDSVMALARTIPGVADIQRSWKEAKPEIQFVPDRMRMDEYGMNVAMLGFFVRNALTGSEAAVYRETNDEITMRVQYGESDRNSLDAIENISIPTMRGIVPVKALAKVVYRGGAANIDRKNRQRLVTVTANVTKGASGTKAAELQKLTKRIQVPSGYRIYFGGQQEMMAESFGALGKATLLAILLTFMVLAGTLESLVLPLFIMITIPLGFIGVISALLITGKSISMISLMSMIMLIGVVVNNAILVIDYSMMRMKDGLSSHDAMMDACKTKFHAILMMNLAIVTSSIPAALQSASIQAPFAITAIGGVAVSTLMTLFVIPAMVTAYLGRKGRKTANPA